MKVEIRQINLASLQHAPSNFVWLIGVMAPTVVIGIFTLLSMWLNWPLPWSEDVASTCAVMLVGPLGVGLGLVTGFRSVPVNLLASGLMSLGFVAQFVPGIVGSAAIGTVGMLVVGLGAGLFWGVQMLFRPLRGTGSPMVVTLAVLILAVPMLALGLTAAGLFFAILPPAALFVSSLVCLYFVFDGARRHFDRVPGWWVVSSIALGAGIGWGICVGIRHFAVS
jgi:hypothetical protein